MTGTISSIYTILKNDTTLVDMLSANYHFTVTRGVQTKENSIIPSSYIKKDLNTPFLSIQEGSEMFYGETVKRQIFYIRCYNSKQKTYVQINEILERVRFLLHKADLVLDDRVKVSCRCEGRLPALEDQAFALNYKEERYSVVVL